MELFPREEEWKANAAQELAEQINLAERMHRYWMYCDKAKWLDKSPLPAHVLDLAMMLNVQQMRLFRSVIEEASRGEGSGAIVNCRTLFETVVALTFILKASVRIVATAPTNPASKRTAVASISPKGQIIARKDRLDRALRANLYLAHVVFADSVFAKKVIGEKGCVRIAKMVDKDVNPAIIKEFEKRIGSAWTEILRNRPRTYSGLPLGDLVKHLNRNLYRWYLIVYHYHSRIVHAADAIRHAYEDEQGLIRPAFLSTVGEVGGTIHAATVLMWSGMALMHEMIDFGVGTGSAIAGFKREMKSLMRG